MGVFDYKNLGTEGSKALFADAMAITLYSYHNLDNGFAVGYQHNGFGLGLPATLVGALLGSTDSQGVIPGIPWNPDSEKAALEAVNKAGWTPISASTLGYGGKVDARGTFFGEKAGYTTAQVEVLGKYDGAGKLLEIGIGFRGTSGPRETLITDSIGDLVSDLLAALGPKDYETQEWELFNTIDDPSECHDLASENPELLKELVSLWWVQAGQFNALPLENRGVVEIFSTPRPQIAKPRERYIYYPGGSEIPESAAPNIRNRSYTIAVEVDIHSSDASGVLFSHGARFGGHALYIKDGRLKYVYNWVGMFEQIVESADVLPTGHLIVSASFEKKPDTMPAEGTLTLHVGTNEVGAATIKTQPGRFSIAGEGLNIGKDSAEPVSDDYPGASPWPFVGGTIARVVIDVSGEPFVDLAKEAAAAYTRD